MKTYQFYLNASNYFLNGLHYSKLNINEKEYSTFSSILLSWICLESYINSVSMVLLSGKRLNSEERAFLDEREIKISDEGEIKLIKIRPSTTRKILFLLNYFSKIKAKNFKKLKIWGELKDFEELRNKIIHHKAKEDINISLKKAEKYNLLVRKIINYINKKIFGKSK